MYKLVPTHENFVDSIGKVLVPILTLQEGRRGLCHIIKEDDYYISYLFNELTGFVPTEYIFPELHAALITLPELK